MNLGLTPLSGATGGLSLVRVLGTLSRTLGLVRQISPLYKEIKPLIAKAPVFFEKMSALRSNVENLRNLNNGFNVQNTPMTEDSRPSSGGPVFFQ